MSYLITSVYSKNGEKMNAHENASDMQTAERIMRKQYRWLNDVYKADTIDIRIFRLNQVGALNSISQSNLFEKHD